MILLGQSRLKNIISLIDNKLQINPLLVICNVIEKSEKRNVLNDDDSTSYFYHWGLDKPFFLVFRCGQPRPGSQILNSQRVILTF